jgi:hypothetical protein
MTEPVSAVPDEFAKVMRDFISDLKTTFPEYVPLINKWWKEDSDYQHILDENERKFAHEKFEKTAVKMLFDHSKKKLPPRFFDILYQNDEMFKEDSDVDTEFFPKIHFKNLWQCDISDKTRETIWKYLQLMTFSIIGTLDNKDAFGDTAKMFEAINQDEFKTKLEETLSQIQGIFDMSGNSAETNTSGGSAPGGINMGDMPSAEQLHEHISGMLDGKLGKLAREIAEETAADLDMDLDDTTNANDVLNKLVKDPTKLMGLVKTVGSKLDTKIKSGDIKESELIAEATEMMNKMKSMPGMESIKSMLGKMGMGNLNGLSGGKLNMGAMEAQLNQKMKMAKTKERIRAKAEAKQIARMEQHAKQSQQTQQSQQKISDEELFKLFSNEEKIEKTPRGAKPQQSSQSSEKQGGENKKKKGKK